ncbi:cytochrome P450 [Desertimonas flava]|uniref:cytochrome P450 n=1 Tax=Desertimonas flava TaxID=2064846 RepID=UPI0013C50B75|nr:cytochrome P450 [Desertimonas flava]
MTTGATVDLRSFNPFDPATLQCPFPHYAAMRAKAPVHEVLGLGMFMVTRHDLVLEVVRDPVTYSNQFGQTSMPLPEDERLRMAGVMAEGYPRVPTMLTADPPDHTRYRRLVTKAFTPKAIAALEPAIRSITCMLIDSWIGRGRIEFVTDFAVPLPVRVIATALNVPDERLADFKKWSDDSIAGIGTALDIDGRIEAERGVNDFQRYFADQLEQRRREPQDDLLTNLLNARVAADDGGAGSADGVTDERGLDMPEMLSILQQLLVAGNETTTKMLTEMIRLLAEHPEEWRRVKADPSRVEAVVEETLRLSTPTQGMFRIVTRDVTLGGVDIPAGSRLVVAYCSANRDESLYDDPDAFDPDRANLKEHLAFGKGVHFCLGAALSRLEGKVALEELSRRLDTITLPASNRFEYFPSFMLRGLTSLDLEFTPAQEAVQ